MYINGWWWCLYEILIRGLILNGVSILMSAYWYRILYSSLIYRSMMLKSVAVLALRDMRRVNCKPRCAKSLWHWKSPLGRYGLHKKRWVGWPSNYATGYWCQRIHGWSAQLNVGYRQSSSGEACGKRCRIWIVEMRSLFFLTQRRHQLL